MIKEALLFALSSVHGVLSVLGEHPYWASDSPEGEPVPECSCYRMLKQVRKEILMALFAAGSCSMLLVCILLVWKVGNLCKMVGGNGKEAVYLPNVPVMLKRVRKDLLLVLLT